MVIFLNCLLFSLIAPMISFFASLFFYIKYNVDKYNLIFVYYKVFESGGKIRKVVTDYMLLNLFLYFVIIVCFFTIKFNQDSNDYFWIGIVIMVLWALVYCKIKRDLMKTYKLDKDLRYHAGIKSGEVISKVVLKNYK